jgi:hypothetical protein
MRKFLALMALSLPLAAAAQDKAPQPAHEHGSAQQGMSCEHMKDMMAQMEKAPNMSTEQKAAAFDAHMKQMREMMSKMHGGGAEHQHK